MFFNTNFFRYLSLYVLCSVVYSKDKLKPFVFSKEIDLNSRICIYGFGPYGRCVFRKLFFFTNIVGIFDISLNKFYKKVLSPDKVCKFSFDYIIVTVMNEVGRASALRFLSEKKVPIEKIIILSSKLTH